MRDSALKVLLLLSAVIGLYLGWSYFWFLCDDAYIAFRYVSNSQLGHGYVWNAPPFQPVEGYTSFLWVAILDLVWRSAGVDPVGSANFLSLLFAYGSLAVVASMVLRLPLSQRLSGHRLGLLALVLLGILSNRTFLTWTTSGLETSLFTFLVLGWTYVALWARRGPHWTAALCSLGVLIALTRPDGLLFVVASAAAWVLMGIRKRHAGQLSMAHLWGVAPLSATLIHLSWRHSTYGSWLPNSYYAKHVGSWPEAGARYLGSFLLEYAFWLPLLLALWVAVRAWRERAEWLPEAFPSRIDRLVSVGLAFTLVAQFAYYTFLVGGDYFEYRIYHYWVPLTFVALPWLLDRLGLRASTSLVIFGLAIAASWPIQWTHRALLSGVTSRRFEATIVPVAPHFPAAVGPYVRTFDSLQRWLTHHRVGVRYQHHRVVEQDELRRCPSREEGLRMDAEGLPTLARGAVGVVGWTLPHVAIIDRMGLNDRVVARNPLRSPDQRRMAHDREPPRGYVECFRPNVTIERGNISLRRRTTPLTPEQVQECERRFMELVENE